jgi:hypothetical protein
MTGYHAFSVIDHVKVTATRRAGLVKISEKILLQPPDVLAEGVVSGILCFVIHGR